jgi:hypothetical protein
MRKAARSWPGGLVFTALPSAELSIGPTVELLREDREPAAADPPIGHVAGTIAQAAVELSASPGVDNIDDADDDPDQDDKVARAGVVIQNGDGRDPADCHRPESEGDRCP